MDIGQIIVLLEIIVSLCVIVTPIIKLNTSIVKLNCSVVELQKAWTASECRLNKVDNILDNHEKRLWTIEKLEDK